jgi:hypothetical protein
MEYSNLLIILHCALVGAGSLCAGMVSDCGTQIGHIDVLYEMLLRASSCWNC